jgi:hypothetical protein
MAVALRQRVMRHGHPGPSMPIYTTLVVVVVAEHALLQHLARLRIKLRLLRPPAWASTVTRFASPVWLWLRPKAAPVIRRKIFLTAHSH